MTEFEKYFATIPFASDLARTYCKPLIRDAYNEGRKRTKEKTDVLEPKA